MRKKDFEECALLMSSSEPWITLKRDYNACLAAICGAYKTVFILKQNTRFIGFAILQLEGTFKGYIQSICLSPEVRGHGNGKAFIRFCEEIIYHLSPNVFLCVSSFNTAATQLYLQLGYEQVGVLKNFIIDGFDELLMRKSIGTTSTSTFKSKKKAGINALTNLPEEEELCLGSLH